MADTRIDAALRRSGLADYSIASVDSFPAARETALVRLTDGTARFLKWRGDGPVDLLVHEAVVLDWIGRSVAAELVPGLVDFDPAEGVLVTEGQVGFHTLRVRLADNGALDDDEAGAIANGLARLHLALAGTDLVDMAERAGSRLPAPIPTWGVLSPAEYAMGVGSDYSTFLATAQSLEVQLQAMRAEWRELVLVHCDLRDDNVLLPDAGRPSGDVRIVDWEMARLGDPLFDLGSLIGQLFYRGLAVLPGYLASGRGPDPLEAARVSALRLTAPYVSLTRGARFLGPMAVTRLVRFAGLFLLLRALGHLEFGGQLGRHGQLSLMLARRLIAQPQQALDDLLAGLDDMAAEVV